MKLPFINERGDNRKPGITWGQRVGNDECPYLRRWVFNFGIGSLRVHHWTASDDDRAMHDHPWWFLTLVLRGGYTDVSTDTPDEQVGFVATGDRRTQRMIYEGVEHDHLSAGSLRFRRAHHAHTVQVDPGGCWTVMLTGKHSRDWGFWTDGAWLRMRRYFKLYGHHPCED